MAATTTPALPLLAEIQQLALARPGPFDSPAVVAAWYEAKAALLDRLADSTDPEAAGHAEQAIRAHQHALDLRQGKDF